MLHLYTLSHHQLLLLNLSLSLSLFLTLRTFSPLTLLRHILNLNLTIILSHTIILSPLILSLNTPHTRNLFLNLSSLTTLPSLFQSLTLSLSTSLILPSLILPSLILILTISSLILNHILSLTMNLILSSLILSNLILSSLTTQSRSILKILGTTLPSSHMRNTQHTDRASMHLTEHFPLPSLSSLLSHQQ